MYTRIVTITGWTWEYIDDFVTIPRLLQMEEYWGDHPPIHQMLAAFFGIEPKNKDAAAIEDSSAAFLRDFIAAGGVIPDEIASQIAAGVPNV